MAFSDIFMEKYTTAVTWLEKNPQNKKLSLHA